MYHSAALLDWCLLDPVEQRVWGMENGNQTPVMSGALVRIMHTYQYSKWFM